MGQPTLGHEQLPLRLYALARAGQGELREWQPRWNELPLWPLVWSLRRCGWNDNARGAAGLARLWQRWSPSHRAALKYSRHECCTGLVNALTWEARLTWLLLLLEGHGERAVDPLLELLRQGDEETRQLVALGLAQLGRQILPDLKERWRSAGAGEKQAICQTLWYLGPQARGCLDWLQSFQHPWAQAVFYAMEEHGWPALLPFEFAPLWLDSRSLERVGELVFSTRENDRMRALAALRGWGPQAMQAQRLLDVLARDPVLALSQDALTQLLDLNATLSPSTLRYALLNAGGKLRTAALHQILREKPEWAIERHLKAATMGNSSSQQRALVFSLDLWDGDWLDQVLDFLGRHGIPDPELAECLQPLLRTERQEAALPGYFRLGGDNHPLKEIAREGPMASARLIFESWLEMQHWDGLFDCLARPELLDLFLRRGVLRDLLERREFSQITHLAKVLRQLEGSTAPSVAEWCAQALQQLEPGPSDWEVWKRLTPEAREHRLLLMEWQRKVPDGLVEAVRQGQQLNRQVLAQVTLYREDALDVLLAGLGRCSPAARTDLLEALRHFGLPGWRALLELQQREAGLDYALEPEISRQLYQLEAQQFMLERGPLSFTRPFPPLMRMTLAESLLGSKASADQQRRQWALALVFYPESTSCALHYLLRCYPADGRELLRQALHQQNAQIRYEALKIARFTCPDWATIMRDLQPDPDPEIRRHIGQWLSEEGRAGD